MQLVVGISDLKLSDQRDDVLVTYSLGSCVGLTLYDREACIGGLIHCMLPMSKTDNGKAKTNPYMFVDSGVQAMLQTMFDMGARRNKIIAKVAGASNLLDDKGMFRIGERNYTVLRKVLWKNDILIAAEDVGGTKARTVYLYMESGETVVKSGGEVVEL